MIKKLIRKILGRESAQEKIVNPYVGLTDAQIIERRRKIAVLYPTPRAEAQAAVEQRRERERAVQREADDMGFATGLLVGSAFAHMGDGGGSPSVPLADPSPSFEAGGGDFGGGGASESFDSPSDSGGSE